MSGNENEVTTFEDFLDDSYGDIAVVTPESEEQEGVPSMGSEEIERLAFDFSEEREDTGSGEREPLSRIDIDVETVSYERVAEALARRVIQDIGPVYQDIDERLTEIENNTEDLEQNLENAVETYFEQEILPYIDDSYDNIEDQLNELSRRIQEGFESIETLEEETIDEYTSTVLDAIEEENNLTREQMHRRFDQLEDALEGNGPEPQPEPEPEPYSEEPDDDDEYDKPSDTLEWLGGVAFGDYGLEDFTLGLKGERRGP